jgi:hypothetical protein
MATIHGTNDTSADWLLAGLTAPGPKEATMPGALTPFGNHQGGPFDRVAKPLLDLAAHEE